MENLPPIQISFPARDVFFVFEESLKEAESVIRFNSPYTSRCRGPFVPKKRDLKQSVRNAGN